MNTRTLSAVARIRNKNASDLARAAQVSRAAVSLWMKKPQAEVKARHLLRLAEDLKVPMDTLMQSMPLLEDQKKMESLRAALLWDKLFPSIEEFAIALARRDPRAIGRYVQVYGLFQAEKIIGRDVWDRFPEYRIHLHPARAMECEKLCRELKILTLI